MKAIMRHLAILLSRRVAEAGGPVAGLLLMSSAASYAQESVTTDTVLSEIRVVPRISITETLTDNVRLTNAAQQSEQITEISPGIRLTRNGGRMKVYFDYAINAVGYAQNSSSNRHQNALNTFATLELLDNWMSVDVSGSVSQQTISAFGTQSNEKTALNTNQTEVSNYRFSPYVRGHIGDLVSYEARYSRAVTQSEAAIGAGVATAEVQIKLSGVSMHGHLGWSADARQERIDYSAGRTIEDERLNLGLTYSITPQLSVAVNGGRENSNFTSSSKEGFGTHGFGVSWSPSEMTRFAASRNFRSFGDGNTLSFIHRTPRTAWTLTDARDISTTPDQMGVVSLGAIYDILFTQFAAIEPDPVTRSQLVNSFLQSNSINPIASVTSNFLTSAVSLQRRQDLSIALLGVRDTLTFIASRSESSRLDTLSRGIDDLSRASIVRQHGFSFNYAHRLTPAYALSVQASQQVTSGESGLLDSTLNMLSINLTGKVSRKTAATVGMRHSVARGSIAPYAQTAVTVNLIVQL